MRTAALLLVICICIHGVHAWYTRCSATFTLGACRCCSDRSEIAAGR